MPRTRFHVRWMIRADVPGVLLADAGALAPWAEEDLLAALRPHSQIGMVAEDGEEVVGFLVYRLHKGLFELLRLGVRPEWRRQGVGRALLAKLAGKLDGVRRDRLTADVPEREVGMQLFLRACGFRCTSQSRTTGDSVYGFERRVAAAVRSPC